MNDPLFRKENHSGSKRSVALDEASSKTSNSCSDTESGKAVEELKQNKGKSKKSYSARKMAQFWKSLIHRKCISFQDCPTTSENVDKKDKDFYNHGQMDRLCVGSPSNDTQQDQILECSSTFVSPASSSKTKFLSDDQLSDKSLSRDSLQGFKKSFIEKSFDPAIGTIHTQIDYVHWLVPDLLKITNCNYYWGVMDRFEAEKLLESRAEGTFLLRDSAQEEFLFSVSFRRYGRSLHARIEQWDHKFSFDSHDSSVFASKSVCGLIEHYKDPSCCMFFEPMLTIPLSRTKPFSLQHLCRVTICNIISYDGISFLPIPKLLMQYLQYYHYKQKVRVRQF